MTDVPTAMDKTSAGDPIPPKCSVIEVHVGELKQLFDAIDPSPFRDRDLDPKAAEFIVGWAKDLPHDASLALLVDLDREAGLPDEAAVLGDAIHEFFRHRAEAYRQRLRELFRVGRTSLAIGLLALAGAIALGDFLATLMKGSRIGEILRESLTIRRVGLHVAPSRGVLVRLVADSQRSEALGSVGCHAGTHQVRERQRS